MTLKPTSGLVCGSWQQAGSMLHFHLIHWQRTLIMSNLMVVYSLYTGVLHLHQAQSVVLCAVHIQLWCLE